MSFANGLGRDTPRGDFTKQWVDRGPKIARERRSKSIGRLPAAVDARYDKIRTGISPNESPRDVKPLQGRGRPKTRQDDRPVLMRPPASEKKGNRADPMSQTVDLSEVFNRPSKAMIGPGAPKKVFGRSHSLSRIDKVVKQNFHRNKGPTSQKPLPPKGQKFLEQLAKTGSKPVPILGKGGRQKNQEETPPPPPLMNDALLATRPTRTSSTSKMAPPPLTFRPEPPITDDPGLSPGRPILKDRLSTSDTFIPIGRDEMKGQREEDQGGGEARAVSVGFQVERDEEQSPEILTPYLYDAMQLLDSSFEWGEIRELGPHAGQITMILNKQLEARRITKVDGEANWKVKGIPDWIIANDVLKAYDEPNLEKCMNKILPDLQRAGYFRGKHPSPWQILHVLKTDMKAVNLITKLEFGNLGLSDRVVSDLPVCQGIPLCMKQLCLPRVKYVTFTGNRFRAIPQMLYEFVPNVEVLVFSRNHITTYPEDIFVKLRKLYDLDLSAQLDPDANSITEMPYEIGIWSESKDKQFIRINLSRNLIDEVILDHFPKSTTHVVRVDIEMSGNPVKIEQITKSNNGSKMAFDPDENILTLAKLTLKL